MLKRMSDTDSETEIEYLDEGKLNIDQLYIMKHFFRNYEEYTFERFKSYNDDYKDISFNSFVNHNLMCIRNLSRKEAKIYAEIIMAVENKDIAICDEECCVEWTAYCCYFNLSEKFVILNPR